MQLLAGGAGLCKSETTNRTTLPGCTCRPAAGNCRSTELSDPLVVVFELTLVLKPARRRTDVALARLMPPTSGTRGNGAATSSWTAVPGSTTSSSSGETLSTVPRCFLDGTGVSSTGPSPLDRKAFLASFALNPVTAGIVRVAGADEDGAEVGVGVELGVVSVSDDATGVGSSGDSSEVAIKTIQSAATPTVIAILEARAVFLRFQRPTRPSGAHITKLGTTAHQVCHHGAFVRAVRGGAPVRGGTPGP